MVSLRKYLDMHTPAMPVPVISMGANSQDRNTQERLLADLCSRLVDQVAAYVCPSGGPDELRAHLDAAKGIAGKVARAAKLSEEDASGVEEAVRLALASRAAQDREAARRTSVETQQVIGVLNDALLALTGGSQRSVSRLERIQESLARTARIRDAEGLRASLAAALTLIREETEREQENAARDLADFESKVVRVRRQLAENPGRRLGDRADAVRMISDALLGLRPECSLYAVAVSVANVQGITQRYGPDSVSELFIQVITERIHPLAAAVTAWRWSPCSVVALFEGPPDIRALQAQLAEFSRAPFVYRMTLGNRTAVLKAGLSHMIVALTTETFRELLAEIDRFSGTEPAHGG
jgi:hypothetical protein